MSYNKHYICTKLYSYDIYKIVHAVGLVFLDKWHKGDMERIYFSIREDWKNWFLATR